MWNAVRKSEGAELLLNSGIPPEVLEAFNNNDPVSREYLKMREHPALSENCSVALILLDEHSSALKLKSGTKEGDIERLMEEAESIGVEIDSSSDTRDICSVSTFSLWPETVVELLKDRFESIGYKVVIDRLY